MIKLGLEVLEDVYDYINQLIITATENNVVDDSLNELMEIIDTAKPDEVIIIDDFIERASLLSILDVLIKKKVKEKRLAFLHENKIQMDFATLSLREYLKAINSVTDDEMFVYMRFHMETVRYSQFEDGWRFILHAKE